MFSLIYFNLHETLTFQSVFAINKRHSLQLLPSDLITHCYIAQRHTSTNGIIVLIINSLLYHAITTRFGLITKPLSGLLMNYKDTVSNSNTSWYTLTWNPMCFQSVNQQI